MKFLTILCSMSFLLHGIEGLAEPLVVCNEGSSVPGYDFVMERTGDGGLEGVLKGKADAFSFQCEKTDYGFDQTHLVGNRVVEWHCAEDVDNPYEEGRIQVRIMSGEADVDLRAYVSQNYRAPVYDARLFEIDCELVRPWSL